jgi:hypothetical protein
MSKSKAQGTAWETALKRSMEAVLPGVPVVRLVEGGVYDRGDLAMVVDGQEFILEARDRETMEVHKALLKAQIKAGPGAIAAVVWKRKARKPGNTMRTQVGPPVVVLGLADWQRIMQRLERREWK